MALGKAIFEFSADEHRAELVPLLEDIVSRLEAPRPELLSIVRAHPRRDGGFFSKAQLVQGFRRFAGAYGWTDQESLFLSLVRMKPIRTLSGVAPVTVLTKPFPCPGQCIFCPNDVRMPKSYLANEPGAQRAGQYRFDPYLQTLNRLRAMHTIGHSVDKVELIVLGGTWSFYPEAYQIWFIKRCFDAMNTFHPEIGDPAAGGWMELPAYSDLESGDPARTYNEVVTAYLRSQLGGHTTHREESADWAQLEEAHRANEGALARCVGLVLETRPDHIDEAEVTRLRRLGATKVQIGVQSMSDEVLRLNKRGHDVDATRRAFALIRQAGFKIHAHWMPNLYGSSPAADVEDYVRLFEDPAIRPDELKIYPCSLIESAELMGHYRRGEWRPYSSAELVELLADCMERTPPYCRLTRIIRDIPGTDIVEGNKLTNLREEVERALERRGTRSRDIRAREVRGSEVDPEAVRLERVSYETAIGRELFLQFVDGTDRLIGFLRLSLPSAPVFLEEIAGSAMIREVHVYGALAGFGERDGGKRQHRGYGRRLVEEAAAIAVEAGYADLAVVSAIGTRAYYRGLGFKDDLLYQHLALEARC
ncbi:MAG: elongator complex protein 3 [Verrucomicrobiota bacterium]|jgi:elongator complex protein 3